MVVFELKIKLERVRDIERYRDGVCVYERVDRARASAWENTRERVCERERDKW